MDTASQPPPLPPPAPPIFPAWICASIGCRFVAGHASLTNELGRPMLLLVMPAVDGDEEREALAMEQLLVSPRELVSALLVAEEKVLEERRRSRPVLKAPRQALRFENFNKLRHALNTFGPPQIDDLRQECPWCLQSPETRRRVVAMREAFVEAETKCRAILTEVSSGLENMVVTSAMVGLVRLIKDCIGDSQDRSDLIVQLDGLRSGLLAVTSVGALEDRLRELRITGVNAIRALTCTPKPSHT